MELKQVRELVKLVEDSGIEELEITEKDTTIRIQKSRPGPVQAGAVTLAGYAQPVPPVNSQMAAVANPASAAPAPLAATAEPAVVAERANWKEIHSPIVGTFYRAPAPNAEPFVRVGDRITPGQTLCIIEAMKVMNEIEAEFSGVIKEILVDDATPVEAEAILYLVDPA
jgi:acetyl-CoA carboxylase biotin carboxyl carrier protein